MRARPLETTSIFEIKLSKKFKYFNVHEDSIVIIMIISQHYNNTVKRNSKIFLDVESVYIIHTHILQNEIIAS